MAGNSVTLTFAGDAGKLQAASRDADRAVQTVGDSVTTVGGDMDRAGGNTDQLADRFGDLGSATTGALDSLDALGGGLQAVVDIQEYAKDKAADLAQALQDAEQAQNDLNQAHIDAKQATRDAAQATLDVEQAALDAEAAKRDELEAIKEYGAGSIEARQAALDLLQAEEDLAQANLDAEQSTADLAQANSDASQAQLDLNEATRAANPPQLQEWADKVGMITPLLSSLVGVVGLVTAAQWAWNAAQLASPTTWIVLGILALVGVIVLIATKTDWFQRAWRNSWRWIKEAASNTWDWLKKIPGWIGDAFGKVAGAITRPFRSAFNFVADAWNSTIGSLSWSVPGWVPGIGGNTISVPDIPKFHAGGRVPGPVGSEQLAILQGGEKIESAASRDSGGWVVIRGDGLVDTLIEMIARQVGGRGGDAAQLGIRFAR